jgi:lipopolysaccharide/colanic/teichoic acid biosynthesis glycosyltransferase
VSPVVRAGVRVGNRAIRRVLDVFGAGLLLALSLPVLASGIAVVAVGGGRPVFFGHLRLGLGGRPFRCWKLRTMSVDAEEELDLDPALLEEHRANGFKLPTATDPRVARWGRFLRTSYVDEIPQLFNVLKGDMSLVGPRPIVPEELALFGQGAQTLLEVKPGVFGAWNSRGRERPPYPARADLELDYVRNRGWARDVVILVRSVRAVLQGQQDP